MADQKAMWNKKHAAGEMDFGPEPSEFGLAVSAQIKKGDKVLELGCAVGRDARLFAELGADVTATDLSDVVIAQCKQWGELPNLKFEVVDIGQPLPYDDASFTVVYARLSLHYWNAAMTAEIFSEIARILAPGGRFYFSCKSMKDPMFGEGEELEPGVFLRMGRSGGHIRHFFSSDYTRKLASKDFEIIKLEEVDRVYTGDKSAFVECWARKRVT